MPDHQFSATRRQEYLQKLSSTHFDLLVIGGGITGAGIALDASSRGLKVALVEKQDFAAGTSSRSTKLIHGGLRYLKQFEINLVREVGREREIVYRNAPHLVVPEKMLLPIIHGGSLGEHSASFGLYVYDWLAGVKRKERRRMLSKEETSAIEPLFDREQLIAGALYTEYRTDDARLVIENIKTAIEYGAVCMNYISAVSFIYDNDKATGIVAKEKLTGAEINIKARQIVNAAGPWVDEIRGKDSGVKGKRLHLTKGVHIVFPKEKLPIKESVYFDVPGGRMIFAIPRGECTYVGTTDTNYKSGKERPSVTQKDVSYLLEAVNNIFPTVGLKQEDIVSSWCGLRPLIHQDGKSPSELSRKDEVFHSPSGVISIAGGKLTGYRKMAEKIADMVMKNLEKEGVCSFKPCFTDKIKLHGGDFSAFGGVKNYIDDLCKKNNLSEEQKKAIRKMVLKYGTDTEVIITRSIELIDNQNGLSALDQAEVWYCVTNEMVCMLSDFLIRRSGKLYFERPTLLNKVNLYSDVLVSFANMNTEQVQQSMAEFEKEYMDVLKFVNDSE